MNLQLIKKYGASCHGGLRKLAVDAGMSEANLHRCIRNNKIQTSDLEALSRRLGIEMEVFLLQRHKRSRNASKWPNRAYFLAA